MSSNNNSKGHCYGFNIKGGAAASSDATSSSKPAIITDRFQTTAVRGSLILPRFGEPDTFFLQSFFFPPYYLFFLLGS